MDAGHFTPGRRKYILFDDRGIHFQCKHCNGPELKGNPRRYEKYMLQRYGQEVIDDLDRLSLISDPWTTIELKDILVKYKQKALREAQKRGIITK